MSAAVSCRQLTSSVSICALKMEDDRGYSPSNPRRSAIDKGLIASRTPEQLHNKKNYLKRKAAAAAAASGSAPAAAASSPPSNRKKGQPRIFADQTNYEDPSIHPESAVLCQKRSIAASAGHAHIPGPNAVRLPTVCDDDASDDDGDHFVLPARGEFIICIAILTYIWYTI
jgi:hypothetical protein